MENGTGLSGRKRGITRHSVEDQALDQIAKEKLVNIGGGKSTKDEGSNADDQSRSASTSPQPGNNQDVKKRQRSRRGKKNEKSSSPVDKNKAESDEENQSEPPRKHNIPEEFYEDLSETDKSKSDGSTSQDVSSSDLNDELPDDDENGQVGDTKEVVDFDEFWEEFDKESSNLGKVDRKKSVEKSLIENEKPEDFKSEMPPNSLEGHDVEDFWASSEDMNTSNHENVEETATVRNTASDIISNNDNSGFWGEIESVGNEEQKNETTEKDDSCLESIHSASNSKPGSKANGSLTATSKDVDDEDFWGEIGSSEHPKRNEAEASEGRSISSEDKSSSNKHSKNASESAKENDANTHTSENNNDASNKNDLSNNEELDVSSLANENNVASKINESSNNEELDFWGNADNEGESPHSGDEEEPKQTITENAPISDFSAVESDPTSATKRYARCDSVEDDFWENRDVGESASETTCLQSENEPSNPGELLDDESHDRTDENCASNLEEAGNKIQEKNDKQEVAESDESQIVQNSATEEPSLQATDDSIDDFWGSNDDVPPPVFQIRKSVDESSIDAAKVPDLNATPEQVETVNESSSSSASDDSSSESTTHMTDNTRTEEVTHRAVEETNDTTTTRTEPEVPESKHSTETHDKQSDTKEVHRRSFINVLRDIETPNARRRSSAVLPDNRERTAAAAAAIREERQETRSRSTRPSESSADGDGSEDDGIMDYLGKENKSAEARLAARRQARVEAREIRMRELERLQREQEENSDRVLDLHGTPRQMAPSPRTNSYQSSRRSSEDSMEDGLNLRDLRHELKEVEEKFRKAMVANAQLDNEKAAFAFQVELFKDKLEDLEETYAQLQREHKDKCREHEILKRAAMKLKEELSQYRQCLEERDRLIADFGLVIVGGDVDDKGEVTPRALVSNQSAEILESAGEGSLDVRLKLLAKEKNELADEVRHLKLELEEERNRRRNDKTLSNGPIGDELQQTLNDYRFRLQKAEQETNTLQATVARLESQVIRYKSAAETSEKAEDELKIEKRKLQREHRESIARIEELETANSHLQRRMDKLKNAKSTLLKEL